MSAFQPNEIVRIEGWVGVWHIAPDQVKSAGMYDFTRVYRLVGTHYRTRLVPNFKIHPLDWQEPEVVVNNSGEWRGDEDEWFLPT